MRLSLNKKAVMGIGMLIIFISSILVAAVAAGVIIRSTGKLQQLSLEVEEGARERIVNRLDIITVEAIVNTTSQKVIGFEFWTRLSEGSYSLDFNEIGITFTGANNSAAALYFDDNTPTNCSFANLTAETEFCFNEIFGDGNNVLKEGELVRILYKLNETNYLDVNEDFDVSFIPTRGTIVELYLTTPKVMNKPKVKIRS